MERPEQLIDDLLPTRSSLVSRLRCWDDQESWQVFFDTYWKLLYCVAVKAGLSDAEARDVVQETVIAVARNMRDRRFQRKRGSFRSWLLTILHRRVVDQVRKRRLRAPSCVDHGPAEGSVVEEMVATSPDGLQEIWNEEWARSLADAALQRVKSRAAAKQFQMFDLYVIKERPVREVAGLLGVNVAQVYLAKCRILALVRMEVKKLRREANRLFNS